jgi:hypothetical protein
MTTTIQVSEEFRDRIYDSKDRTQSYEDWLREELGWDEDE